jgi:hypothetical protein
MEEYLDFGGTTYYIDFEAFDSLLTIDGDLTPKTVEDVNEHKIYDAKDKLISTEVSITKTQKNKEINIASYETIRMLMEIVLTFQDDNDDTLGPKRALATAPLSFKISFNTLLKYGIIKEL